MWPLLRGHTDLSASGPRRSFFFTAVYRPTGTLFRGYAFVSTAIFPDFDRNSYVFAQKFRIFTPFCPLAVYPPQFFERFRCSAVGPVFLDSILT